MGLSAKMIKIIGLVKSHQNKLGKVVIFSTFASFLTLLKRALEKELGEGSCGQIDGSVAGDKRSNLISQFQEGADLAGHPLLHKSSWCWSDFDRWIASHIVGPVVDASH